MISCRVHHSVLHIIFPPSDGTTWTERQNQFLNDQLHPEKIYSNPERCKDVLRASARYEGENRFVGFNFPASVLEKTETTLYPYKTKYKIRYVIAYMKGDKETIDHEKRHAKYYIDAAYRRSVRSSWKNLQQSQPKKCKSITKRLQKDGYKKKVWMDEFQAYYPEFVKLN